MKTWHHTTLPTIPLVGLAAAGLLLSATGGAVAGQLITGADVKDSSLTGDDIKDRSLDPQDASKRTEKSLQRIGGYEVVTETLLVDPGSNTAIAAECSSGRRILGVSSYWADSNDAVQTTIREDGRGAIAFTDGLASTDSLVIRITCGRTA